jgi:hypothetical protein
MSLEMIEKITTKFPLVKYSMLGGEPTQHSQFSEILNFFSRKKLEAELITNLLFNKEILNTIISHLDIFWNMSILANAMELDTSNRLDVWKYNYITLEENNYSCCLAITITKNNINSIVEYIKNLYNEVQFKYLRLGIDLCGNAEWIVNNKSIGKVFEYMDQYGQYQGFHFVSDCQVPPCINNEGIKLWHGSNTLPCDVFPPADVFPDGAISYCYPLKEDVKLNSIFNYNSVGDIMRELIYRYVDLHRKTKLPTECYKCEYYESNICQGVCLGTRSNIIK